MQDILDTIGATIGSFFGNPIVQAVLQFGLVYAVVLWLAAAYWAYRDMQLRSENPVLPYVAAAIVVLFTPVLFPFGVLVYRIIRPQERIGEVYERNLAEEALLAEVEAIRTCPGCTRRVHDEWIICPTCRTRLNRVCPSCSRLVGLEWSLCAWCGRDFEPAGLAAPDPIGSRLDELAPRPAPALRPRAAGADAITGTSAAARRPAAPAPRAES